jgi:hypothetical protein
MSVMTRTPTASSDMPMTPKPQTLASQPTGSLRPAVSAAPTSLVAATASRHSPYGTEDASRIVSATLASVSREACTYGTEPSALSLRHQESEGKIPAGVRPTSKDSGSRDARANIYDTVSR